MGTVIVIIILLVVIAAACKDTFKHFKGNGGCCGGGDAEAKQPYKKLDGEVKEIKTVFIEGMHCQNCKNTVEKYINQIEGASAQVNLKKNIAVVKTDRVIEDFELRAAVARAGFTVKNILKD